MSCHKLGSGIACIDANKSLSNIGTDGWKKFIPNAFGAMDVTVLLPKSGVVAPPIPAPEWRVVGLVKSSESGDESGDVNPYVPTSIPVCAYEGI